MWAMPPDISVSWEAGFAEDVCARNDGAAIAHAAIAEQTHIERRVFDLT
jgi:hypothetical protein